MAFELDPTNKRKVKRRLRPTRSNSFDNPFNNRDGKKERPSTPATQSGAFGGDYIGRHFGTSKKSKKARKARLDRAGSTKEAKAARAVLESVRRLSDSVGSASVTMRLKGGKNADDTSFTDGGGDGGRPADNPAAQSVESVSPSDSRSASPRSSSKGSNSRSGAAVARSQEKKKPGKAYEQTRSYWKNESERAKRFDMEMTGDEIRKARAEFLRTHPAARAAVKNGSMSMGDINIMVRRLAKRKKSRQG